MCERGHHEDALLWYQQALRGAKEPAVRAAALGGLGRVALAHGDVQQAATWLEQGLEASHGTGAEATEAGVLLQWAALEQKRGEFKKAASHGARALRLLERAGDPTAQGDAHWQLAGLCAAQGQAEKAREHLEKAEALYQQGTDNEKLTQARQALARLSNEGPGTSPTRGP
jgi:tetratricopeptide (TPR) repeat protein